MNPEDAFREACKIAGHIPTPPRPAKILLDDQVLSSGLAHYDTETSTGSFSPQDGRTLDTPIHGATLMLLDTQQSIPIAQIHPCRSGQSHVHLRFAPDDLMH